MEGTLKRRTFIAATGTALSSTALTTTTAAQPTYPPGEAPEPTTDMLNNEWFGHDWQLTPNQPDGPFTYFHGGGGSALIGVVITYIESDEDASSILEMNMAQYPEGEVSEPASFPEFADEMQYYDGEGMGPANHLIGRTDNALFDVQAARQQPSDGEFYSDPDMAVDAFVSLVYSLGEEDIDPEDYWGTAEHEPEPLNHVPSRSDYKQR